MSYFPIGFHTGVAGANQGIGEYMRRLDDAGIPFNLKITDDALLVHKAIEFIKKSDVPHNVIFRIPTFRDGYFDLPDTSLTPTDAAIKHWNRFTESFPPELVIDREWFWIEPTNEIDTHAWGEWLGEFMYSLGVLILRDGYRGLLSGFNAGQPEPVLWYSPGMKAYLKLCEANHDKLGISLHEGKLEGGIAAPIDDFHPHLIGRFQWLYDACDDMDILYPKVYITECAWKFDDMPNGLVALQDIEDMADIYDGRVNGVFLWNLAGNTGPLPGKLQKMIEPVTQMALNWNGAQPIPQPPQPSYRVVVNLLPQNTTLEEKWYVLKRVHDLKETILQSADDAARLVLGGRSDSVVKVWSPTSWQDDIVQWLRDKGVANIEIYNFSADAPPPPNPPTSKPFFIKGLDAPASDWRWPAVHGVFDVSGLSPKFHTDGIHVDWWDQYKNPKFNLVRIYLNPAFIGDSQAIFDETENNIDRFYLKGARDFEVWNEPNIENQMIWGQDGAIFGSMFRRVCQMYMVRFPEIRLWFPGMSPQFGGQYKFIDNAIAVGAFQYVYGICEHVYTGSSSDITALNELVTEVSVFRQRYATNKPLVVSEFSVNSPNTASYKAKVYRDFYLKAKDIPNLLAAYCYTSDWEPSADKNQEGWFKYGIHNEF